MANFAVSTVFSAVDHMTEKFQKWTGEGDKFEHGVKKNMHEASESAKMFGSVLAANLATKGIELLGEGIKKAAEALPEFAEKAEEIGRSSMKVGIGAEEFQKLRYAAHMTDVDAESLQTGLQKLNLGMGQLAVGQGSLYTGLMRVNPQLMLQVKGAGSAKEAFMRVADAVAHTTSAQQRAAIAVAAFGKQGQSLLPILAQGREGIEKLMSGDKDIIPDSAIENGERFSDAMKQIKNTISGFKNQALAGILEGVAPALEKVSAWMTKHADGIKTGIAQAVGLIGRVFETIGPPLERIIGSLLPALSEAFTALGPVFSQVLGIIVNVIEAIAPLVAPIAKLFGTLAPVFKVVGDILNVTLIPLLNMLKPLIEGLGGLLNMVMGSSKKNPTPPDQGAHEAYVQTGGANLGGYNPYESKAPAPNVSALKAGSASYQGRLEISGAPVGSKLTNSYRGAPAIRPELVGQN